MAWDHPRAYQPLEAFAEQCPSPSVSWDRQSLADFEARPVTELAKEYDILIIDHPGLGAAIAAGAIQPLRRLVPREVLDEWKATSFVPTWDSYVVGGQPWALPVDAATQVSAYRPDLIIAAPRAWAEVPALARERRVALCLGGPHAFLTVLAMCAPGESLLPPEGAWIRPRDDGWIGLQSRSAELVREVVTGAADAAAVVAAINSDYRTLKGGALRP